VPTAGDARPSGYSRQPHGLIEGSCGLRADHRG